jgi:sialidase-1
MMKRLALLIALSGAVAMAQDFQQSTVWKQGEGAYKVYRIPAAIVTTKGTLLAFCEGRVAGGADSGEINLLVKRSSDNGKTFSPQSIVWADGKNTCGNPCPVVDASTGAIHLLMTHNLGEDRERDIDARTSKGTRTVWISSSTDDGATWSKPRDITSDTKKKEWTWYATGPGVGIQITQGPHTGQLVIPCDYSTRSGATGNGNSHIIYSDDHGVSWHIGGEAPKQEFNESQIVELPRGELMLNMRNRAEVISDGVTPYRGVCISDDGGITFSKLRRDKELLEPICQASIIRYTWRDSDGHLSRILFSNPSSIKRQNMAVRMSYNEGGNWIVAKVVHEGPSAYSCLVILPDRTIGLLYECGDKDRYERIDFAHFKLEWLNEKDHLDAQMIE